MRKFNLQVLQRYSQQVSPNLWRFAENDPAYEGLLLGHEAGEQFSSYGKIKKLYVSFFCGRYERKNVSFDAWIGFFFAFC